MGGSDIGASEVGVALVAWPGRVSGEMSDFSTRPSFCTGSFSACVSVKLDQVSSQLGRGLRSCWTMAMFLFWNWWLWVAEATDCARESAIESFELRSPFRTAVWRRSSDFRWWAWPCCIEMDRGGPSATSMCFRSWMSFAECTRTSPRPLVSSDIGFRFFVGGGGTDR
ncbi:predicted protein [Clavispora lusitaniae ATCC 42720]|uniref:Uncharacterized protein n=1 Tax=Clavispora lusitaniae (strain ATCC 42720) TaxID=306902 RepID=C4Y869_CLAL4|nr:uncharacterized protein CLUG_04397 [Clavispora lusitaniae ATCC 42720]EEQ40270.1 predicted protein [Clavispora lusitaniae ATCC 42720]